MAGLLWISAGVMQLAAVVTYYVIGFGVGFVLLELFVAATFALTYYQIRTKGDREHHWHL